LGTISESSSNIINSCGSFEKNSCNLVYISLHSVGNNVGIITCSSYNRPNNYMVLAVAQLVGALHYKPAGHRFDS
jgi:hypothetical protein